MTAQDLAEAWTAFWNGELERGDDLLTGDFRVHFGGADVSVAGDAIKGPEQMAAFIRNFRAPRPQLRYFVETPPIADDFGFALRWRVEGEGVSVSGIDVLRVEGTQLAEVWSLTGERRFPE